MFIIYNFKYKEIYIIGALSSLKDGPIQRRHLMEMIEKEVHISVLEVKQYLAMQHRGAVWFRDASLAYFQTFAKRPFANGYQPKYPLDYYKALPPNTAPPD
jgi:alpha-glucuronidase